MAEHLAALESAIADVGCWTWWAEKLPATFQVEFGGVQFWSPPSAADKPPSNRLALRFRNPRIVHFLTMADGEEADWPDRLHRDELEPPTVDHESFTLTSPTECADLIARAVAVWAMVGEPGVTPPSAGEAILGFVAGGVGLVVAAESMVAVNHQGELDGPAVLAGIQRWWEYWQEYWRRRNTPDPMPWDGWCEVTIPLAPDDAGEEG